MERSSGTTGALLCLERYGWIVYWLLFVVHILYVSRDPGLVGPNAKHGSPWGPTVLTCGILGAQTAALNATLRPVSSTRSWQQVAIASGLALLFAVLSMAGMRTDMPGYYYTPALFALSNLVVVPLAGATLVLRPHIGEWARVQSQT